VVDPLWLRTQVRAALGRDPAGAGELRLLVILQATLLDEGTPPAAAIAETCGRYAELIAQGRMRAVPLPGPKPGG